MSILKALHAACDADRDDSVARLMKMRICWHPTLQEKTWSGAMPDVCCLIDLFSRIGTQPSLVSGGMGGKDKVRRQLSWEPLSQLLWEADWRDHLLWDCSSLAAGVGSQGISSSLIWSILRLLSNIQDCPKVHHGTILSQIWSLIGNVSITYYENLDV